MPIEFKDIKIELPESAFKEESVVRLVDYLTDDGMAEGEAKALVEELLSEEGMAIGDAYLKQMASYVRQVEQFRAELRSRTTELLASLREGKSPDTLPERLSASGFRMIFRSLEITLDKLKPPDATPVGESAAPAADRFFDPSEIDQLLGGLGDEPPPETTVPRVRRGRIDPQTSPGWEGEPVRPVRVPRKPGQAREFDPLTQMDRLAGETLSDAVARVRQLIGELIDDTPLKAAWAKARSKVLKGRSVESLGKEGALKAYEQVRDQFWQEVRDDPAALDCLKAAGLEFRRDTGAPTLRVTDPNVPVEQIRVSLDHAFEKSFEANWKLALDGDNLVFEFHAPNSFRDSTQRAFGIGTYSKQTSKP